jgi:hypothetical protein
MIQTITSFQIIEFPLATSEARVFATADSPKESTLAFLRQFARACNG